MKVVDQSGPPDPYGQGEHQPAGQRLDRLEGFRIHHLSVFNTREGLGIQFLQKEPPDLAAAAHAGRDRLFRRLEGAVEHGRGSAFVGIEIGVPGGHGEAVRLADGRPGDDLDRQMEVAHHLPDDRELLGVFLAEHGDVRPHQVEEGADDGGDAAEVAGAARAFEPEGGAGGLDERGIARRVDRLYVRQEEEVAARGFEHGGVLFRLAGVAGEVLVRPELGRVDEDGRHDPVGPLAGDPHEGEMPLVESAHGGHERDSLPVPPPGFHGPAEVLLGSNDPHARYP